MSFNRSILCCSKQLYKRCTPHSAAGTSQHSQVASYSHTTHFTHLHAPSPLHRLYTTLCSQTLSHHVYTHIHTPTPSGATCLLPRKHIYQHIHRHHSQLHHNDNSTSNNTYTNNNNDSTHNANSAIVSTQSSTQESLIHQHSHLHQILSL